MFIKAIEETRIYRSIMVLYLLILLFVFLGNNLTIANGPNMNDLVNTECPKETPFLCLPYGRCCSDIEYCHAGNCEPCFTKNISECELLTYCKHEQLQDESKMKKGVCAKACEVRLAASKLSDCDEEDDWKRIFIISISVLGAAGVTVGIVIFVILRLKKRKQRRMPPKNDPENNNTEEPLVASDVPVRPELERALSREEENRDEEKNDVQPLETIGIELREFGG